VTSREERLARNEAAFRALNEEIETKVHANLLGEHSNLAGYVCECSRPECTQILRIHMSRYEEIRRDSLLFIVADGHEVPDIEDVVHRDEGFNVVRKHDEVADIAEATDPRR
jgi:hypothetical protein